MKLGFWLALAVGLTVVLTATLIFLDLLDIRDFVPLSEHYDWLAFVGAVLGGGIGGLITFGGVYLTLRQQRESDRARNDADELRNSQRRDAEDLRNRLSIMPLFEYSMSYDPADFDNSAGQLAGEPGMPILELDGARQNDSNALKFLYDLIIRNVGLGHGLITDFHLDIRDNQSSVVKDDRGGFVNFLVKTDSRRDIRYHFYSPRIPERFKADPTQVVYSIVVTIRYHDLLENEYEQILRTSIAKGLFPGEDPATGGKPYSSFHYADPPRFIGKHDRGALPSIGP